MKSVLLSIIAAMISAQAWAGGMKLGQPQYGGTGCPAGTASVTLSPDETELSVLFDNYMAEAGSTTGRRIDRKSCNLAIPVQVPQGYSVGIFKVDYRGYDAIPRGGSGRFDTEYFWAGSRGPRISKVFNPGQGNFTLTHELLATTMVWSACGDSVNFRINSSALAQSNSAGDQAMVMIDSADVSSKMVYHLQWRRCY